MKLVSITDPELAKMWFNAAKEIAAGYLAGNEGCTESFAFRVGRETASKLIIEMVELCPDLKNSIITKE